MWSNYSTACGMYNLVCRQSPEQVVPFLMMNALHSSRQQSYTFTRSNMTKIGFNCFSNRLQFVSNRMKCDWQQMSYEMFKVRCKDLFINKLLNQMVQGGQLGTALIQILRGLWLAEVFTTLFLGDKKICNVLTPITNVDPCRVSTNPDSREAGQLVARTGFFNVYLNSVLKRVLTLWMNKFFKSYNSIGETPVDALWSQWVPNHDQSK